MIKGILFDKDGTLIEFISVWHDIIRSILEVLEREYFFSRQIIDKIKEVSGIRDKDFAKESIIQYYATSQIIDLWFVILANADIDGHRIITYKELMALFEEKTQDENLKINAVEGTKELLAYLKNKNYIIGIATADTYRSTIFSLKKADILNFFDYIGCNEEGVNPKPANDMAVRFCLKYQLIPEEILIVGDSVTDMLFAENSGTNFIGIKTPYNHYEKFHEHHMPTVDKLRDIVVKLSL
ncbi:MAG TPA: HAD family hydrolase [Mobilitalea sp.]|nr:HAD family hydrolase [Mobilitalea sp.]